MYICHRCNRDKNPICDAAIGLFCFNFQYNETYFMHKNRLDEKRQLKSENIKATQQPAIYIGAVASKDSVIKSVAHRDRIAKQKNVIAFKMKKAGVWDEMPCIMIKGVCDYANRHKHKKWQNFATAMAAAAAKAILERYTQTDRKEPEAGHLKSLMPRKMPNHRQILQDEILETLTPRMRGSEISLIKQPSI
jgi:hypothetical protein